MATLLGMSSDVLVSARRQPGYNRGMKLLITASLFAATTVAEIVGCYLPYLWLRQEKSPWLILPAAASGRTQKGKPFGHHFGAEGLSQPN